MSSGSYKRATKNHAVRIDYIDGSMSEGFVPVPFGVDIASVLQEAQGFLLFKTEGGEATFLNLTAIKAVTSTEPEGPSAAEAQAADQEALREHERAVERGRAAEEAARRAAAEKRKKGSENLWTAEEYDALEVLGLKTDMTRDDLQTSYRKLVKLYHPDRLSGLGVSADKIEFAAQKLAEINSAYHVLIDSDRLAA